MASESDKSEFHRSPQIRLCVANIAKQSGAALEGNDRKFAILRRLRDLDRPQNSFSYLLALIEKVSDTRGSLADAELEEQILRDIAALREFLQNARG